MTATNTLNPAIKLQQRHRYPLSGPGCPSLCPLPRSEVLAITGSRREFFALSRVLQDYSYLLRRLGLHVINTHAGLELELKIRIRAGPLQSTEDRCVLADFSPRSAYSSQERPVHPVSACHVKASDLQST